MTKELFLDWENVKSRAHRVAEDVYRATANKPLVVAYGVPAGGIPAALLIQGAFDVLANGTATLALTEDPFCADVYLDDIVDSGKTRERTQQQFGTKPFFALVDKTNGDDSSCWYSFPWERMTRSDGPKENIVRLLQYIGEDPNREGLRETPDRVLRSYRELFAGYNQDPKEIFKTFEDGACDEMVVLRGVEFWSFCEHHMLPFSGQAHVAYIPKGRIIGISKLARLVEVFARRLQVQERLTVQVTRTLDEQLKPEGSACVIEASHLCMACRGVQKQRSVMVTSSLTGVFRQPEVRAEFFQLVGGGRS